MAGKLESIVYHENESEKTLEIQFYEQGVFISIIGECVGGIKADSFMLSHYEAEQLGEMIVSYEKDKT